MFGRFGRTASGSPALGGRGRGKPEGNGGEGEAARGRARTSAGATATDHNGRTPSGRSGAGGRNDRVGEESGDQAGQESPGGDLFEVETAGDSEQLDDDVEDRAGGQGKERDADRGVGVALPDQGADEGRP